MRRIQQGLDESQIGYEAAATYLPSTPEPTGMAVGSAAAGIVAAAGTAAAGTAAAGIGRSMVACVVGPIMVGKWRAPLLQLFRRICTNVSPRAGAP